jgi:NADH:ubiquinone reductase (H+-translocating)
MKHLIIIGGGFSGFWSAMSAVRQSREMGKTADLKITVINKDSYLTNRPRLYEANIDTVRTDLQPLLAPLGVTLVTGLVTDILPAQHTVTVQQDGQTTSLQYDYLIVAAGSRLKRPDIPGGELIHNIDEFNAASELHEHLAKLAATGFKDKGADTVVVVGGGLTGIEIVTGLQEIVNKYARRQVKIVLIDRQPSFGSSYSPEAREYINEVLLNNNIDLRLGTLPVRVDTDQVYLANGEQIAARTVVWTAGMEAGPLHAFLNGSKDNMNRIAVDEYFKVPGYENIMVTGDAALSKPDGVNHALMSCQYSLFQGKWSGHNAVADLFGGEKLPYAHSSYVTCIDLGPEKAIFTRGWERKLEAKEDVGKKIKTEINTVWIVPSPDPEANVAAAIPVDPAF